MPVNLNNILKVKIDNRDITNEEFLDMKTFITDSQNEPDIPSDPELEKNIRSMLERWGVTAETRKQELIAASTKLYQYRLKTKKSRVFWRLLKYNLNNILI